MESRHDAQICHSHMAVCAGGGIQRCLSQTKNWLQAFLEAPTKRQQHDHIDVFIQLFYFESFQNVHKWGQHTEVSDSHQLTPVIVCWGCRDSKWIWEHQPPIKKKRLLFMWKLTFVNCSIVTDSVYVEMLTWHSREMIQVDKGRC